MRRVSKMGGGLLQHVSWRRAANDFCRPPFACSQAEQEPNHSCLIERETCGLGFIGEIE